MIGQRIESRPSVPWGAMGLFAAAVGLAALAGTQRSPHPAIAAILPVAVGIALLLARPARFIARLTEEGLELDDPPQLIPYAAIAGLTVAGKPTSGRTPLYVFHEDGVVRIPPTLTVRSSELYQFLASRLSESGSRDVPPPLTKYVQRQTEIFGPATVFTYRARPHPKPISRKQKVSACLGGTMAGLAWVAVGFLGGRNFLHWIVIGGVIAIVFGMSALAYGLHRRRGSSITNWQQSGLVIGPAGLALVQGDDRGEMRWEEMGGVEFWPVPRMSLLDGVLLRWTGTPAPRGIILSVPGARIVIADIYDRPLPLIYDRIRSYWQGREPNA